MSRPTILVVGTLDTKGPEIEYLRAKVEGLGASAIVLDSGILGEAIGDGRVDISRQDVASAAGMTIDEVRAAGSRGAAVEIMVRGITAVTARLFAKGRVHGVVTLGGAEGALLGAAAMHALPLGVPKVIVSPSASGRRSFAPFVGTKDVLVMHSVVDILGLNPISRSVFDNAAAAVVGMARDAGTPVSDVGGRSVAVTMLGQTTPGVMHLRTILEPAGIDTVIFHANGVGGPAMEELIEAGAIAGVIEYSLSELANTIKDGIHAVGDSRLTVAGAHGLPQVVVPGCADFFNQGAPATLPEEYRQRKTYYHNPVATLVRLNPDEMAELGALIASRLSSAKGPVSVVFPTRGFSLSDAPGGALWDPEADAALLETLRARLGDNVRLTEVDGNANDLAVADAVAREYLAITQTND
ncbi:MAG: Tm-1-like ATP-binding domain-containing protein [Gaiellales bacterium]